jgi:hypothetical protein
MSKEIQKPKKTRSDRKILASQAPALVAALSMLTVSLGVTIKADEESAAPANAGESATGVKFARKAGKGQTEYAPTANQQKLESSQQKLQSDQMKLQSNQKKLQSNQKKVQ